MTSRLAAVSAWVAAIALVGCGSLPRYLRPEDPARQLKAPADRALVVFIRPSRAHRGLLAHVMDEQANFLGTAPAGGHFSVVRAPGKQSFVVWSEAEDILVADLAPGLVYFVEVEPAMGVLRPRFILRASRRGSMRWPYQQQWLDQTTQYWVDRLTADEQLADQLEARRELLRDAADRLAGYRGQELADHTLVPSDGHAGPAGPGTVATAAPAAPEPPSNTSPPAVAPGPAVAPPSAVAVPGELPRGYPRGSWVRVRLKDGRTFVGEVRNETRVDLKLIVGAAQHLFDFVEIESIERLALPP